MNGNFVNFYDLTQTETSSAVVVFNILLAFALSAIVVYVWKKTHKGLSYSQSFAFTIIMLGPLASTVMMIVKHNLIGAFALLGAFSLIRFRTIIKETRDVAFLFFSLTIGVGVGMSNYAIAFLTTIIVSALVLILYKYNFGAGEKTGFVITFSADREYSSELAKTVFSKHLKRHELINANIGADLSEYAYSLQFKDYENISGFIDEFRILKGIKTLQLITGKEAIEY